MKKFTKILTALLVSAFILSLFTTKAQAETQKVDQNSTVTVNCTSGSYGQSNNCYAVTNQNVTQNSQVLGVKNSRNLRTHNVVNTAVATSTMFGAILLMLGLAGLGYAVLKLK